MKVLGIELVPVFSAPMQRRLQLFGATFFSFTFIYGGICSTLFLFYLFFYTRFYWITVLYMIWYISDLNVCHIGGRRFEFARRHRIWEHMRDYFPVSLVKTADLDSTKNYVFGSHPHGILCCGAFVNFSTEATSFSKMYPGLTPHVLTLTGQFWWPLYRELVLSSGACAVSRESFRWILNNQGTGNIAIVVVGGAAEALDGACDRYVLTICRRKGFIKMAMESGSDLVPTFSFGENNLYQGIVVNRHGTLIRWIQEKLIKVFGYPLVIIRGRGLLQYSLGLIPRRGRVVTVVGKPIAVEKNTSPTKQQINELHQKYMHALKELFEEHKGKYGAADKVLEYV